MPIGLWRGTITGVETNLVYINIPHLGADSVFTAEPLRDVTLEVGQGVLCGWFEGRAGALEIIRLLPEPTVVQGLYTSTYGGTY